MDKSSIIDPLSNFDPRSCVLFLGSGFAAETTNIKNQNPPIGNGLRDEFAELLQEDKSHDLKDLADVVAQSPDHDLYQILYECFTITNLPKAHRDILGNSWRRIYTTNYDDSIELHYFENGKGSSEPKSYSYTDQTPKHLRANDIVHLHGYIRKCRREAISQELILGHESYVEERLKGSAWYDLFSADLDNASEIYFVGYSLSDFNIAAYLMKNPALVRKTHFIVRGQPNNIFRTRVEKYGSIYPIGVDGFANCCRNLSAMPDIGDPRKLTSFNFLDPQKDDKIYPRPSGLEIRDLMTLGHFNFSRLVSTFPESSYVVPREGSLVNATKVIQAHRTMIIHAYVENGKSIFKNILALALAKEGYRCFEYKHGREISDVELTYLRKLDARSPPVIFFSSYDDFRQAIGQFADMPDHTRFVLEMDTGTFYVRQKEVSDNSIGILGKLDLNRFEDNDAQALERLLDKAGILNRAEFSVLRENRAQIREYVLELFNNSSVRDQIENITRPLLENYSFRKFVYASFISRILDVDVSMTFLYNATGVDPYDCLDPQSELGSARDLFEFSESRVQPRSAILVEYMLKEVLEPSETSNWIQNLAVHAAEVKEQELDQGRVGSQRFNESKHLLGSLFQFSNLTRMFAKKENVSSIIGKIYENGRNNASINREPLFWLQYCIYYDSLGNSEMAERYLATAYDRANTAEWFRSYQLDTYALSLYMRIEEIIPVSAPVSRFDLILEKLSLVRSMLDDGNHRRFAWETLAKVESFVKARNDSFKHHEKVQLVFELNLAIDRLAGLPIEVRTQFATDQVKASIIAATNILTA